MRITYRTLGELIKRMNDFQLDCDVTVLLVDDRGRYAIAGELALADEDNDDGLEAEHPVIFIDAESVWKDLNHTRVSDVDTIAKKIGLNGDDESVLVKCNVDIEQAELGRVLHRVVRAMHDGHCPSCGLLKPSEIFYQTAITNPQHQEGIRPNRYRCPRCLFAINEEDAIKALEVFRPFLQRSVDIFKEWNRNKDMVVLADPRKAIETSLVLSTSKIKQETSEWLAEQDYHSQLHVAVSGYAFVIFIGDGDNVEAMKSVAPDDLVPLLDLAVKLKVSFLILDRDADSHEDLFPELPTYDW